MTLVEKLNVITSYLSAGVPVVLASEALPAVSEYTNEPDGDIEERKCYVYNYEGKADNYEDSDQFIITFQLPGVNNPQLYTSAILPVIIQFDPSLIGGTDIEVQYASIFMHETEEGQNAYSEFLLKIDKTVDDCEVYDA